MEISQKARNALVVIHDVQQRCLWRNGAHERDETWIAIISVKPCENNPCANDSHRSCQ